MNAYARSTLAAAQAAVGRCEKAVGEAIVAVSLGRDLAALDHLLAAQADAIAARHRLASAMELESMTEEAAQ